MNEKDFTDRVRQMVSDYTNEHLDPTDGKRIQPEDVFIMWQCKTLQNSKALCCPLCWYGIFLRSLVPLLKTPQKWERRCQQDCSSCWQPARSWQGSR